MIKSITVRNYLGKEIYLELTRPDKTGLIVTSVEGLGPAKATINVIDISTNDGGVFNSSRLDKRNIVMKLMSDVVTELGDWTTAEENTIMAWFNNMKDQLSEDAAVNLQLQINADEVERLLTDGLPDGTKTFSEDGTVIRSVDSKGRVLVKIFTDNFLTITSELKDREDKECLPYPYPVFNSAKSVDVLGVTFTDNEDGTITANGTAIDDLYFIISDSAFTLEQDVYNLSGCPIGGSVETYYFGADLYNDSTIVSNSTVKDTGYGAMLDLTDKTYTKVRVFICIKSHATVNNITFTPSVNITGTILGTLVKKISADGNTIETTITNNPYVMPNLVEIEEAIDALIAKEDSYIGDDDNI